MWWNKLITWFSELSEKQRCVNEFNRAAKDAFIYGSAVTIELESYITDRIVLLANVRERVLWGSSLGNFNTQFGLGVKFIIN